MPRPMRFSGATTSGTTSSSRRRFSSSASGSTRKLRVSTLNGRAGPSLKGVFGRKSAALDDYRYSNPMKRANLTWDEANLRDYIVDPQARVKGNRMPFAGVRNPKDADDLVAFLKDYK